MSCSKYIVQSFSRHWGKQEENVICDFLSDSYLFPAAMSVRFRRTVHVLPLAIYMYCL